MGHPAWGSATIYSNGTAPIQYTIQFSCLGGGTGKYELDATVEHIQ